MMVPFDGEQSHSDTVTAPKLVPISGLWSPCMGTKMRFLVPIFFKVAIFSISVNNLITCNHDKN